MGSYVVIVIVNFGGDTSECTDELDISSAHVQWFSHPKVEQMFVTSFYDIIMIPYALGEGSI